MNQCELAGGAKFYRVSLFRFSVSNLKFMNTRQGFFFNHENVKVPKEILILAFLVMR